MALPFVPNVTCDVYHPGSAPPAAPNVSGVAGHMANAFPQGFTVNDAATYKFTHVLRVGLAVDVRDNAGGFAPGGIVCVPDQNGTQFNIVGVIRSGYGGADDHRVVYLIRAATTYPTSYL